MAKPVWLAVGWYYYFYQITFNFMKCYFGYALFVCSYCAAALKLPVTVCSVRSGKLTATALEGKVLLPGLFLKMKIIMLLWLQA